jgi:hypothetical protein
MFEESNFSPQQESPDSSHRSLSRRENPNKVPKWLWYVIGGVGLAIIAMLIAYGFRTRSDSAPVASTQPPVSASVLPPSAKKTVDCGIYKADDCSTIRVATATLWQSVQDPEWTLDCTVKGKAKYVERPGGAEPVFDVCDCKCEKSEKKE